MRPAPAFGRPSLKRPLSSDGAESLPSKLFAATINGSPAPSPRRREASPGVKRTCGGEEETQARRWQLFAAPLPTPSVYHAPEPPTRAPTPAPEPGIPATWLGLVRSLQAPGISSLEPLPPRPRRRLPR